MPTSLGCGTYEVYVLNRGATEVEKVLPFTSCEWNRELDQTSTASVELLNINGKSAEECCRAIQGVEPWKNEIGVYRDGARVWAGPIVNMVFDSAGVHISCRDLSVWLTRRRIHSDYDFVGIDLAVIFNTFVADAMFLDNSPGLVVSATPCGVLGDRKVLASQNRIAYQEIDELSRTGVDWTMKDRVMVIGNFTVPTAPVGVWVDSHFASPLKVEDDGIDMGSRFYVQGSGVGEEASAVVGVALTSAPEEALYGVHERVYTESTIRDLNSAQAAADSRRDLLRKPVRHVYGGKLDSSTPTGVADLVPGAVVRLRVDENCRALTADLRLKKVTGSVGPEHDDITVDLEPVGQIAEYTGGGGG